MNKRKTSAGWNLRAVMALLILAAFLTSACGQKGQTEQVQETETGEAAEEAAEGEVTAPEEGDTAAKETTEQELLSGELPPWVLYESEKWTVTLNDALDPDDLNARLLLTVDNRCDYNLNVEITEIVINETYRSDEYEYCSSDPHDTNTDDLYGTNRWLSQFSEEIGDLKTISLHLVIEKRNPDSYYVLETVEQDCTIVLPEGYQTEMVFEPIHSMKADRQLLYEDEDKQIELCSMGKSPDDIDLYAITGIVRVWNKTDHSIPAQMAGIRVNGFYIDPYIYGGGTLAAGSERYMMFLCQEEDLELAGIQSINSVELLLLTSEEENTGAYNDAGGSWYSVALTQTGEIAEDDSEDVLVYEDEYVSVFFRDAWLEWHNVDYTDPYGYYHWILVVNNKSSENLEFTLQDLLLDGIPEDDVEWGDGLWPHNTDIGAGSRAVVHLQMRTSVKGYVPELSFRVQNRTLGGGSLLNYAQEPVVIEGGQGIR